MTTASIPPGARTLLGLFDRLEATADYLLDLIPRQENLKIRAHLNDAFDRIEAEQVRLLAVWKEQYPDLDADDTTPFPDTFPARLAEVKQSRRAKFAAEALRDPAYLVRKSADWLRKFAAGKLSAEDRATGHTLAKGMEDLGRCDPAVSTTLPAENEDLRQRLEKTVTTLERLQREIHRRQSQHVPPKLGPQR